MIGSAMSSSHGTWATATIVKGAVRGGDNFYVIPPAAIFMCIHLSPMRYALLVNDIIRPFAQSATETPHSR
jgi:hypothetical protein